VIRDVPEPVQSALVSEAERNRRSKEKQALWLIETGLRRKPPVDEVLAQARKLRGECKRRTSIADVLKFTEASH
jgi:hypothetical protein